MAGTILISDATGVPLSSVSFDRIVEAVRRQLGASERVLLDDVFRPYDQEGMMYISLTGASRPAFKVFQAAVLAARQECNLNRSPSLEGGWHELSEKLSKDPRALP